MDTTTPANGDAPLTAEVIDDQLVIRLGINRLRETEDIPPLIFDDKQQWAKDILNELIGDRPDGNSLFINALARAMQLALEEGSEGVARHSFLFYGTCPLCEKKHVPLRYTKEGVAGCQDCTQVFWIDGVGVILIDPKARLERNIRGTNL